MTSLSHGYRKFRGIMKYMTKSGYDNGRGEGEMLWILDITHPFSTAVINRRLLVPAVDTS